MKVSIKDDACIGCGLCASGCPTIFEMSGTLAVVLNSEVSSDQEKAVKQMKDDCPVDAIEISE